MDIYGLYTYSYKLSWSHGLFLKLGLPIFRELTEMIGGNITRSASRDLDGLRTFASSRGD